MKKYYLQCLNILDDKPKTKMEITKAIMPNADARELSLRVDTVGTSLNQLLESGKATKLVGCNRTMWMAGNGETIYIDDVKPSDKIIRVLKRADGGWMTTREIMEQIYEKDPTMELKHMRRTRDNLHRLERDGIVGKEYVCYQKSCYYLTRWRLRRGVAI